MRDGVLARKTPTPPSNNPWLSPVLRQEASLPQILDRRPPWIPSISNILHPSSGPWRPSSSPVRGSSATFHSTHLHLPQTLPPVFPWTASSNIRNDPLNDFVTKSKWEGKSLRDLQELRLQSLEVASTGKFDQAIPKLRTVVMGLQYLLAPTHEYTAVATYDLAKILGDNNEMNEADAVLNWINRSIVKKYGLRSEVAVMHYLKVVELLRSWLREEDAELLMYKVAELWNQQNTDEVPTMPGSTLAFAPPTTVPEADIKLLFRDPIKTEDDVHIQIRFIEILLPLRTASQLDLEDIGRNILGYCEENELLIPLLRARSCLSKIYESRSMNERATEILDGALPAIQHHLHVSETIDQPVLRSCRELAFRYLDLDNRRKCEDLLEMAADFFEMRVPESQRSQTAINYLISIGCEWQRRLSWKAAAPWFERAFLSSIKHLGESHCKTKLLEKTLEHEHFVLQGQHILEFELQHASL
ncbi:hypothetical protein RRF57_009697 [Xylaria bambusicola]|uniref:Uncharacterized protein n=1 Tax=Xylaria bambusicola TaxID=326684 RepID=A0AAN7ZC36_9PEZI